jgi:exo-1,4-beta-D-glucosaminidase
MRSLVCLALLGLCIAPSSPGSTSASFEKTEHSIPLRQGWEIQSACKVQADGDQLSSIQYKSHDWIQANVPTTVLAAQVAAGIYKDPYMGMNLRNIPGTTYPIGARFSNLPMAQDSPYQCGWWYRKQFQVPAGYQDKTIWLHLAGINYRANIWLNGQLVADTKQIAGAYRIYYLDITKAIAVGQPNVLAVEVFAPLPTELGINWVDWNPAPPDKNMGLWGPVDLVTTGPVAIRSPFITTHFEDSSLKVADITVIAQLQNALDHPVEGIIFGNFAGVTFEQPVQLSAGESRSISFSPEQFPQLKISHPSIWWPAEMGAHPLETLTVRFVSNGQVSDTVSARVGIRDVTSELTNNGTRLFRINGKPILIRGAGWSQDMMLRQESEHLPEQIRMVKDMHLNTIRQEGKLEADEFYHLTDENGILVMAGWCCCDEWEHQMQWTPGINEYHEADSGYLRPWPPEILQVATTSLREQLLRLRSHASVLVWLNGSDYPPTAPVEQAYLNVEKETRWPNPTLSSAGGFISSVTGPSGVKMTGPYNYVSPSYWLVDTQHGGAFGFNTETSPGPAIPQPDSLVRFLPRQNRWPIDKAWDYHAGGEGFMDLDVFNAGMRATYGWPNSMNAYSRIAQTMAYDGERAMFEAYARNKYTSTGVVQWMLNNAWPSVIWHLYDYYLQTGGGYFGTKKACEPVHVQYSYDDHSIYAVSSLPLAMPSLTVHVEVFDLNLKLVFHQTNTVNLAADGSQRVMDIPESVFQPDHSIHFVRLEMKNEVGEIVSQNFYWIPSKLTQFDWAKTTMYTPAKVYADMQALRTLPKSEIHGTLTIANNELHVHLESGSHALAFQVEVQGFAANGEPIIPLLWSDNFIELMPGEHRDLIAQLPEKYSGTGAHVVISGWNTNTLSLGESPSRSKE